MQAALLNKQSAMASRMEAAVGEEAWLTPTKRQRTHA